MPTLQIHTFKAMVQQVRLGKGKRKNWEYFIFSPHSFTLDSYSLAAEKLPSEGKDERLCLSESKHGPSIREQ